MAGDMAAAPEAKTDPTLRKQVWILVLGALTPALDTTIVNVAIPHIGHALNTATATAQWVITGYLLAMGIAMPVTRWATARFGGKRMWLFSLALFLACSMLSGLAWNTGSLIAFRVVQGAAAGLIMPIVTTMLVYAAGPKRLGKVMATASLPAVVVPIFGPVIGGLIVGSLDWRWVFFVNVPICLAAMYFAWRALPGQAPAKQPPRLDVVGLALLAPGLGLTIYGVTRASGTGGFTAPQAWAPLLTGLALTAVFAIYVLRTPATALINLATLRIRSVSAASSVLFLSGLSVYGPLLLVSLYYQQLKGQSVVLTGLLLAPQGIGSLLPRGSAGKITDRLGPRRVVLAGLLLTALGTMAFVWAGPNTSEWLLAASLFIRGAGLAPVTIAVQAGAFADAPPELVPDASSITRIVQQIGGSLGTAILTIILTTHTGQPGGHAAAFNTAFAWSIGFTLAALIPALLLPGRQTRKANATRTARKPSDNRRHSHAKDHRVHPGFGRRRYRGPAELGAAELPGRCLSAGWPGPAAGLRCDADGTAHVRVSGPCLSVTDRLVGRQG